MNTKFCYMYRDASNYKKYNDVVVPGLLSDEEKDEIIEHCDGKIWFIPERVGLPNGHFDDYGEGDHPFCEMEDILDTDETITHEFDAESIYKMFTEIGPDDWAGIGVMYELMEGY